MTPLERRLVEDKAMRDAAKRLFDADVAQIRSSLAERGIGTRITDRIGETATDMADEALELAAENKGGIAAAISAIILWVAREPLLAWLFGDDDHGDDD